MKKNSGDIKILGAGISGLSTAICLAQAGRKVTVYEKNKVGFKENISAVRNYDLSINAVEEFGQLGIEINPSNEIKKVVKYSPLYKTEEFSNKPIFYVLKRGEDEDSLDQQLYRKALSLGVRFSFTSTVEEIADVVATGPKQAKIFGYGYMFPKLNIDDESLHIFYNNHVAPKGYVYVLSAGNKCIVLAVSFEKHTFKFLPFNLNQFFKRNKIIKDIIGINKPIKEVSGFGDYDLHETAKYDGRLYVGEAAGFQDASKGFGVRYALLSGFLAAKSILEHKDYDALWKKTFGDELKETFKRRKKLNKMKNEDYDKLVKKMGKKINIDNYVSITRKKKGSSHHSQFKWGVLRNYSKKHQN